MELQGPISDTIASGGYCYMLEKVNNMSYQVKLSPCYVKSFFICQLGKYAKFSSVSFHDSKIILSIS